MIRTEQVFISASPTTSKLIDVPPGPATVILSAIGSGAAVSFGPDATTLTGTTGAIVNAGQSVTIPIPAGAKSQTLYGTGIGGTAIIGAVVSSPN